MSTNVIAWMIAESLGQEREREATRGARARELRATMAARRPTTTRPDRLERLLATIGLGRPSRPVEPACCVA